tara:strand:+ start:324 stop:1310 length:987 start_codon:yes stop_codon:yes gene_type:complete
LLIRIRKNWEIPEREATPQDIFYSRRSILKNLGYSGALLTSSIIPHYGMKSGVANASYREGTKFYPVPRNSKYKIDRPITPEEIATKYNNYYEFGSHKKIWPLAQKLTVHPWQILINGLVEKEKLLDVDDLIRMMPLEERLYRHRCVERWSIAIPYSGFPLRNLLDYAAPLGSAKYLIMESFMNLDLALGQRQFWYPWPYLEGLAIDEAAHDLAFIATGYYGKPIPKQNGAPLRLAVPWKYGFKHIKAITKFTFSAERPISFWESIAGNEYGFWANVAGAVPHARWSQSTEEFLGPNGKEIRTTKLYNGYAEFVSGLYRGRESESLFK